MKSISITPKLAQYIVDRTMKIIDCNINVMNNSGKIIGSGDIERIGELHEGAMLAISQKRVVTIDNPTAKKLKGVKPGVNFPLKLNDEIVGVIGVTGEPKKIIQFAKLVCMSAEMMMEQEHLLKQLSQDNRLKEEFILSIIQSDNKVSDLSEWSRKLNINISLPHVAVIIEIDSGQLGIQTAMSELQHIQNELQIITKSKLVAIKSLTEIVMLIPALNKFNRWDLAEHKSNLEKLVNYIKTSCQVLVKISLGNYFHHGIDMIARSYQTAKIAMLVGKKRMPNCRHFYYQELILPVLLDSLNHDWQAEELLSPLRKLKSFDHSGILQKTLTTWFNQNLQNSKTASTLFIHRNTLEYRLNSISKLTGLNLSKFDDRVLLYIALQLDK
ncbi:MULTISPECIES: sugar diacid recognition domain-containing protein [unclassified Gilliamella]|uniref:sugar diacid recognition domain-containing protein n=1 Tax=unclassified Gilliamella TaxID=2685620 RepID=UPI0013212171|nr:MULTISPECIES: sugar diacid recognition domain-containing protein [unclassified Gilliamella]MWN30943.1 carbohydrate diacid regulon transcriptional regulator CdaR [Gilliamella sp. Pra-s60]MWP28492.1 carbohydrate diacid regulon transcriptional regulator CdaR [Gilliamella sp. Pra-s54]